MGPVPRWPCKQAQWTPDLVSGKPKLTANTQKSEGGLLMPAERRVQHPPNTSTRLTAPLRKGRTHLQCKPGLLDDSSESVDFSPKSPDPPIASHLLSPTSLRLCTTPMPTSVTAKSVVTSDSLSNYVTSQRHC